MGYRLATGRTMLWAPGAAAMALAVAACLLVLATAGAASARGEALAPWWGVTSGAQPTNLAGAVGKNEVQRLTVSATKGDYLLVEFSPFRIAVVPFDAPASVVQEKLETLYPARRVNVAEEPSGEEDTRVYAVSFPAQAVPPALALPDSEELAAVFGGEPLTGGKAEVSLTEVEAGEATANKVVVVAQNRGDAGTRGKVTLSDELPSGVQAVAIEASSGTTNHNHGPLSCTLKTLTCTFAENECSEEELAEMKCTLPAYEQIEVDIRVLAQPGATGENIASASGGGARSVTATQAIDAGAAQAFGFEDYELLPEDAGGALDTQAGSHPFQLTSVLTLNTQTPDAEGNPRTVALPKDIVAELPPGLIGNPTAIAQCTDTQFAKQAETVEKSTFNECPADSAIGVATVTFNEPVLLHFGTSKIPIFNMTPRPGEPARFGFTVEGLASAFLDTSVRSGGDYGVTVTSSNISEIGWVLGVKLTFWGVPGDPRHDGQRGWNCLEAVGTCQPSTGTPPPPFLVMPTSCEQPFESTVRGDSWATVENQAAPLSYRMPEAIDGCNHLPFAPEIKVTPDGTAASTPTGLNVDVHLPQKSFLNAESLAESAVRGITVALPEGVAINPAGGNGLEACTESEVGFRGAEKPGGTLLFTPTLASPFCPNASKIGTVKIKLPILPNALEGAAYLASQNENPFGSLVAIYLTAEDPVSGVLIKLAGETELTGTGQVIGVFKNSPQGPLEDAELHFFGGERAPLATPARCGAYTTNATFTPWSGNEPVSSQSQFNITSGPGGKPCPGANLPFSPALTGGATNINAGAYTPLTTTIARDDGNQDMQSVQLHMPPGLSGILAGVKLCPEREANEGTCPAESKIGETTVSAGVGSDPVSVKGGAVYITEKYAGAPFGLSIVNPVKAGPFDLEHDTSNPASQPPCDCVVVRAKIDVNPITAALTITTDEKGAHAIPHLIDGIPTQIQKVNVLINRDHFTFNPTNCNPLALTGTITSDEGATSPVSEPFQSTNCAALKFAPKFVVTTNGHTTKAGGASLTVKLSYPNAPFGSQANIARVKVDLPRHLPSRLTTLQKACLASVFEANPAGCPSASIVGHAKAITPLLPVPLAGPAYFVSHGGEAFPSLIIVLQGYGITVDLVGSTFIRNGVTSSTFKTVPDAPVSTFELTLPQGRYSALTAYGNLCRTKLAMPTSFQAQNGAVLRQNTTVKVTNCHKAKRAKRKRGKHK
jgi:hypothetical protein